MTKKNWFKTLHNGIKELKKTEKGKAILFFAFYFIFFVVIFLFISLGSRQTSRPEDYELNHLSSYSVDKILGDNYDFTYTIHVDGNTFVYQGEKMDEVEKFTFNGNQYYRNSNYYFIESSGIYTETTNPYMYFDFLNFSRLQEVLVDATYISKTEFDSGITLFNYLISSNSLIKKLENIDTDILEVPNGVVFTATKEGEVYRVQLDLSSYGKYKGICNNSFNIVLEYSDFGNNKRIVNPIG